MAKLLTLLSALIVISFTVQAPQVAEQNAPSKTAVTKSDEPGEKLVVKGAVLDANGRKPLVGASVYVYQTDASGLYTPGVNDNRNPRLRGYMRTDATGRYEFTTIKPAPYPNNRIPAHIHYVVTAAGYPQRVFEIVFAGDPLIDARTKESAAQEGSAFSIRPLTRDAAGVLQCTQDVVLRK